MPSETGVEPTFICKETTEIGEEDSFLMNREEKGFVLFSTGLLFLVGSYLVF